MVEGLAFAGLPCGSFVYLNRSSSKRSRKRPLGSQRRLYVKQANTFLGCMFICVSNMTHGFYNDILNCACMHIIISMCVCTLLNPVAESQVRSTTDDVDALDYVDQHFGKRSSQAPACLSGSLICASWQGCLNTKFPSGLNVCRDPSIFRILNS